jgi:sugar lactone lactonase YvrE
MGITGCTFSSTFYYVVADTGNNLIRKVSTGGVVTTFAGSGACGAKNGTGTAATFNQPVGICTDGTNLYVADTGNNLIRQIVISSGVVTTLAGGGAGGNAPGYLNGTQGTTPVACYSPTGVATDNTNVYVADSGNQCIRQIVIATGVTTTLAGSNANGTLTGSGSVTYIQPFAICFDGSTKLYICDTWYASIYSLVISTGVGALYAGTPGVYGSYNGTTGTTSTSSFFQPRGVASASTTLFYFADTQNSTIRSAK